MYLDNRGAQRLGERIYLGVGRASQRAEPENEKLIAGGGEGGRHSNQRSQLAQSNGGSVLTGLGERAVHPCVAGTWWQSVGEAHQTPSPTLAGDCVPATVLTCRSQDAEWLGAYFLDSARIPHLTHFLPAV